MAAPPPKPAQLDIDSGDGVEGGSTLWEWAAQVNDWAVEHSHAVVVVSTLAFAAGALAWIVRSQQRR